MYVHIIYIILMHVLFWLSSYSYWNSNPVAVRLASVTNRIRPAPSWKVTLVGMVDPQNL